MEKGLRVVGFDIAQIMIKVWRSKFAGRDSVELMIADVQHMPFRHDSFDLVLCIDTLAYISEEARRHALQEITKFIKPGGLIMVDVKNKACPAFRFKRYRDKLGERYSIASVTFVLKSNDCKIEEVKGVFPPTFLAPIVVIKARKT